MEQNNFPNSNTNHEMIQGSFLLTTQKINGFQDDIFTPLTNTYIIHILTIIGDFNSK